MSDNTHTHTHLEKACSSTSPGGMSCRQAAPAKAVSSVNSRALKARRHLHTHTLRVLRYAGNPTAYTPHTHTSIADAAVSMPAGADAEKRHAYMGQSQAGSYHACVLSQVLSQHTALNCNCISPHPHQLLLSFHRSHTHILPGSPHTMQVPTAHALQYLLSLRALHFTMHFFEFELKGLGQAQHPPTCELGPVHPVGTAPGPPPSAAHPSPWPAAACPGAPGGAAGRRTAPTASAAAQLPARPGCCRQRAHWGWGEG